MSLPPLPAQDIPTPLLVAADLGRITVRRRDVVEASWLFEYPERRAHREAQRHADELRDALEGRR